MGVLGIIEQRANLLPGLLQTLLRPLPTEEVIMKQFCGLFWHAIEFIIYDPLIKRKERRYEVYGDARM